MFISLLVYVCRTYSFDLHTFYVQFCVSILILHWLHNNV